MNTQTLASTILDGNEPGSYQRISRVGAATPYWDGYMAYCEGQPLEGMPSSAHRLGWWAALNAQAEAKLPRKVVVLTDEQIAAEHEAYVDWRDDEDFWRTGGW